MRKKRLKTDSKEGTVLPFYLSYDTNNRKHALLVFSALVARLKAIVPD